MIKFNRTSSEPYTIITPLSPLSELENFLKTNIFALGTVLYYLSFQCSIDKQNPQSRIKAVNSYLQLQPHRILRALLGAGDTMIDKRREKLLNFSYISFKDQCNIPLVFLFLHSNRMTMEIKCYLFIIFVALAKVLDSALQTEDDLKDREIHHEYCRNIKRNIPKTTTTPSC